MTYIYSKYFNQDLELHHQNELEKINLRIEAINKNHEEFGLIEDVIVYSWPKCFTSVTENVYEEPLFEIIHILYDVETKLFFLGHGYDSGSFSSDHIVHQCKWLNYDLPLSLEDALNEGKKLFIHLKNKSEKIIGEFNELYFPNSKQLRLMKLL